MRDVVDRLHAALRTLDGLQGFETVDAPRPAAFAEALEAIATKLSLPPDYVELLRLCDGWKGCELGIELFGVADLETVQENADTTFDDTETDDETRAAAIVVGTSENDARMLYFDRRTKRDDGSMDLVDWLYEEEGRTSGIRQWLVDQLSSVEE